MPQKLGTKTRRVMNNYYQIQVEYEIIWWNCGKNKAIFISIRETT